MKKFSRHHAFQDADFGIPAKGRLQSAQIRIRMSMRPNLGCYRRIWKKLEPTVFKTGSKNRMVIKSRHRDGHDGKRLLSLICLVI